MSISNVIKFNETGINTKFYKFNLNDSNLDINTLSATNTQESTKNFSYSILTGFQHSGGTSEDGDLRVPAEMPTIAEKTVTIKVSHPDFDVTETINFDIQMQFADAVAYYLYIWVQK